MPSFLDKTLLSRRLLLISVLGTALWAAGCRSEKHPAATPTRFTATAYAIHGETAKGTRAHRGIVAADPDVLPLGSRIKVKGAGAHSGIYVVEDTGRVIHGRRIDIFVPDSGRAMKFGKREVEVTLLEPGDRTR